MGELDGEGGVRKGVCDNGRNTGDSLAPVFGEVIVRVSLCRLGIVVGEGGGSGLEGALGPTVDIG